jgi:hypothetical protein
MPSVLFRDFMGHARRRRPTGRNRFFKTHLVPGGLREYDVTRNGNRFLLNDNVKLLKNHIFCQDTWV